jgi:hypothetical protein
VPGSVHACAVDARKRAAVRPPAAPDPPRQVCLRAPALERRLAALDPAAGALAAPNGGQPPDAPAFLRQPESLEARALKYVVSQIDRSLSTKCKEPFGM